MRGTSAERVLSLALLLGGVYALVWLVIVGVRLTWPFEIEWMEGGMIAHAARLLAGQSIYAAPSADFVPYFYTPGYAATLAVLSPLTGGLGFGMARAVSVLATLGAMGLIFDAVRRESSVRYGLLATGLYAALYRTNGAFYDVARPDALFMFLLLGAVHTAYFRRSLGGAVAAGALFALGFFTKQTVSVFVPAVGLYLLWKNWRHALAFGVVAAGLTALGVYVLNQRSDGWFWAFIFEGHQGHLFYWKNILLEYWRDVIFLAPLLLFLPLLWFGYRVPIPALSIILAAHWAYAFAFRARTLNYVPHMYYRELFYEDPRFLILIPPLLIAALLIAYRWRNPGRRPVQTDPFWLITFVAGVGASGLNHSTQWAYSNCFMLLSAFASILIALAVRDLIATHPRPARWAALVPAAVVVQLVAWAYNPLAQIPRESDRAALETFNQRLSEIEGPVFAPAHPLIAWQREGRVHVHQMGIADVAFMGGVRDLGARLAAGEWDAVIVDEQVRVPGVERGYYLGDRWTWPGDALRTKTGFLVRPETLWLRQDPIERALVAGISGNFEGGAWPGWSATGDAFAAAPSRRRIAGMQGKWLVSSTSAGRGTLRSDAFELTRPRLTALVAGQGGAGRVLRVLDEGGDELARINIPNQRREHLERRALDLATFVGRRVALELVDHDPKGTVALDDVRLTW